MNRNIPHEDSVQPNSTTLQRVYHGQYSYSSFFGCPCIISGLRNMHDPLNFISLQFANLFGKVVLACGSNIMLYRSYWDLPFYTMINLQSWLEIGCTAQASMLWREESSHQCMMPTGRRYMDTHTKKWLYVKTAYMTVVYTWHQYLHPIFVLWRSIT